MQIWELELILLTSSAGTAEDNPDRHVCQGPQSARRPHGGHQEVACSDASQSISQLCNFSWEQFLPTLNGKNILLVPFCERKECEEKIKADSTKE